MKKLIVSMCCLLSILFTSAFTACDFFENNTPENPPKNTNGKIGDTLTNNDGVSICLISVEDTKVLGSGYLTETTDNNFILLTIKVVNNSDKQQTFYGSCVDLYNSSNIKYEEYTSIYIDFILSEDIGAGITKTFQVVFETPKTSKEDSYTAKIGYSTYTTDRNRVVFDLTK